MSTKKVLFSEVSGVILKRGKPLAGLTVEQRWSWFGADEGAATARTDEDGHYRFPAVTSTRRQPRGQKDVFVWQSITTRVADHQVTLWRTTKYDFTDNGELGGRPIRLEHELTGDERNYVIPSLGEHNTDVDGVLTIDHPYVHDLERGTRMVASRSADIAAKLLDWLNDEKMLARLNALFTHPIVQPHTIVRIRELRNLACAEVGLYEDSVRSRVSRDRNDWVGFTVRAVAAIELDDGTTTEADLYWPAAAIPLNHGATTTLELNGDPDQLTLDNRSMLRAVTARHLDARRMGELLTDEFSLAPGPELAYAIDPALRMADHTYRSKGLPWSYTPGFEITTLTVTSLETSYVRPDEEYASILVRGELATKGERDRRYTFGGWLCLELNSLRTGPYTIVRSEECTPHFSAATFAADLVMDSPRTSLEDPILLRFTVTNLLPKKNIFLKWHTPFEGFRNEFLEVEHLGTGNKVPYEGPLASRTPPSRENGSYLEFDADEQKSTTIDLRDAYTIREPGRYRVTYRALGARDTGDAPSAEFEVTE